MISKAEDVENVSWNICWGYKIILFVWISKLLVVKRLQIEVWSRMIYDAFLFCKHIQFYAQAIHLRMVIIFGFSCSDFLHIKQKEPVDLLRHLSTLIAVRLSNVLPWWWKICGIIVIGARVLWVTQASLQSDSCAWGLILSKCIFFNVLDAVMHEWSIFLCACFHTLGSYFMNVLVWSEEPWNAP